MRTPWLPDDFVPPAAVELPTGHRLRPIRLADIERDPTGELAQHAAEHRSHESCNYAILRAVDDDLIGCVYIDRPDRDGADADVSWWVSAAGADPVLEIVLATFVPAWVANDWPFRAPRVIGIDISWNEWSALPPAR